MTSDRAPVPLTPDELLTTTRSVRKRLDLTRPVPMQLVRECLQLALQAPTGGNRQGWHWVVVTDPGHRATIGDYYRRSFARYRESASYAGRVGDGSEARQAVQERVASSAVYLAERMGEVPVHVIGCIEAGEELPAGNQAGLWGSLLPAAWSYQLAARTRGLGTAWTTLHLRYEKEISELLGIPPHVRQGVLVPTAYYTGETFRPAPRNPLDDVLHVDRW
jgi:nitroreductase